MESVVKNSNINFGCLIIGMLIISIIGIVDRQSLESKIKTDIIEKIEVSCEGK